jgi:hypothetical protein
MSNTALGSTSFKTTSSSAVGGILRELIAAMPIVIFAKAARAALQRPAGTRATPGSSGSN